MIDSRHIGHGSGPSSFLHPFRCYKWMARCEQCGSAVALGEAACPVCRAAAAAPSRPTPWLPMHPWNPAVEAATWRLRAALGAVLLLAGVNVGLAFLPGRIRYLLPGVVFAALAFFIWRGYVVALLIAAGLHGVISGWLVLTHQITWTFAIGFRVLVLWLILQAIGPAWALRGRDGNAA
jgi:hypothetical protein